MDFGNTSITVTGGSGFLGSHLVEELRDRGCNDIFIPRSSEYDLREKEDVKLMYEDGEPDVVIHLAATVGGIGANMKYPGKYFYDNAVMGIELIEQARRYGIEKFVTIGTICAYPEHTPVPFSEDDLWDGYPEETNAPYGLAKKMLLVQTKAYNDQYGFNGIYLLPVNLYGPRDDFDLETSHVIPAIIRKCVEARINNDSEVVAWGSGEPTREFLYVEDAANGIAEATHKYDKPEPVNIGAGMEISIKELVYTIKEVTGFEGDIKWDTSKPDGQQRRRLDVSKAKREFGWEAETEFRKGLEKTVEWYEENREQIVN